MKRHPEGIRKKSRVKGLAKELQRKDLKPATNLKSNFKDWEDHILAHQSTDVFDELIKIIYAKFTDERVNLKDDCSPCQFNAKAEEPDESVFARVQGLLEEGIRRWGILQVEERIGLLPQVLKHIVIDMQWHCLLKTPEDVLGTAFEYLVTKYMKREKGQYFTPPTVVEMMGKMARVSWDKKVLDPASGSGGFLLWVLESVWAEIEAKFQDVRQMVKEQKEYADFRVFGLDFEPKMVEIAQLNMLRLGDSRTNILVEDSLRDDSWHPLTKRFIQKGTIDIILTNPPFAGDIKEPSILRGFVLASKNERPLKRQVRHLLFLEMCLNYLRPGGILAIVLPKGVFNNPTLKYVRDFIRERAQILACISLDPYVFAPHTGNRTGILVLKKKECLEESEPYRIFMAISQKSGKKQGGRPSYKTTDEGKLIYDEQGKPIPDSDLRTIAEAYLSGTASAQLSGKCFWIKTSELEERLDPEYYISENKRLVENTNPRGIYLKQLCEIAEYVRRGINPTKNPLQSFRYIELDNINDLGMIKQTKRILGKDAPSRARLLLKEGDIITAMSGSKTGSPVLHRAAIITEEYDNCVASTGFGILRPKEGVDLYYLYGLLRSRYVLAEMHRKLQGGGIPKISKTDLLEILVPEVTPKMQREIGETVKAGLQALREAQNSFAKAQDSYTRTFESDRKETKSGERVA